MTTKGTTAKEPKQILTWRSLKLPLLLALGLCSCSTPYRTAQSGKGYSEAQISPDEFEVTFVGNDRTDLEQATDFVLLRSAQVARKHGFPNFSVEDSTNQSSLRRYTVRQQVFTPGSPETVLSIPTQRHARGLHPGVNSLRPQAGNTITYIQTLDDFQPGTTLKIKCYKTKPQKPFTYDAADLEATLKAKYKL
jgi:hypothetical protein